MSDKLARRLGEGPPTMDPYLLDQQKRRKDPFGFGTDVMPDGATVTEEALMDNTPNTMDMTRGSLQWGNSRGDRYNWGGYIPGSYKGLGPGPVGKEGSNWPGSAASTRAVFEAALNYVGDTDHNYTNRVHQDLNDASEGYGPNDKITKEAWRYADPLNQYNHPRNRQLIQDFLDADEWDYDY